MEQPTENYEHSWNDLSERIIKEYERKDENTELIVPLILRGLLEANNSKNIISKDKKIYTEDDFEKVTKFICQKYQRILDLNPFCKKENCLDVWPNHSHSEQAEKERNSQMALILKNLFFERNWSETLTELDMEEQGKYENEIREKFHSIVEDPKKGKEKIIEAFLWVIPYLFQNIEKHSSYSPIIRSIEEKWKNQEKREKWMKENGFWEEYQQAQQEIQIEIEKGNLSSSPKTWILAVIVLLLVVTGWIFYHLGKNSQKTSFRTEKKQSKTNARINF